jgi:peptidoglycan/LPS O-acetylase OafA/YrhL
MIHWFGPVAVKGVRPGERPSSDGKGPQPMTSRPGQSSFLPRGYLSFPEIAGQNAWLDLLRSAAVLLVLFRHGERAVSAAGGPPASAPGDPLQTLFLNGWVGVDLFLVLSGYLIGKGLIRAFDATSAINVKTYFRARALRIVPAYVFVLLVTAAGLFPFYAVGGDEIARRVLYHLLFLQDYLPADINVVFWSLGVEEKFYLLAPILLYCLLKARKQGLALGLLLALLLLSPCIKLAQFLSAASAPDYDMFFASFRSPFHLSLEPLVVGVAISYVREKKLISLSPLAGGWLFAASMNGSRPSPVLAEKAIPHCLQSPRTTGARSSTASPPRHRSW